MTWKVRRSRTPLPDYAWTYLEKNPRGTDSRVVIAFHKWLLRVGKGLAQVTGQDLEKFVAGPKGKPVAQMTRNDYRYRVRLYLRWLEDQGLAGPFTAEELKGYHRRLLPEEVRNFLRFLAPTRRRATVVNYRGFLRRFHEWLASKQLELAQLDRALCLQWAEQIHSEGKAAVTRVGMLVCVRKYLDWLWDKQAAPAPGRDLILASDMPKKPDYLPRPLPPDADHVLQERLHNADSPVALGLLLMRRTGLRIGELSRLERDCIREDHVGGRFLKVPLGKLNNERLVPLDPTAIAALVELQRLGSQESPWLITGARDRPVSAQMFRAMLAKVGGDIPLPEPLTPHRLRHTFATSLMNGGMSLLGIMKLLGHRDQRMTMRYTQIADQTVGREYFEALTRVAERYQLTSPDAAAVDMDAVALLQAAITWITTNLGLGPGPLHHRARLLARRLEAARDDLQILRADFAENSR
jgi:site-specific recombinase XerD